MQGNPDYHPSYLFIYLLFVLDVLSKLIEKKQTNNNIHGISIAMHALHIPFIFLLMITSIFERSKTIDGNFQRSKTCRGLGKGCEKFKLLVSLSQQNSCY
jgi:hypothetical protein